MTACIYHNPAHYVSVRDPERPGWFKVTCGDCNTFIGSHDERTEASNRQGRTETEKKAPRKKRAEAK